MGKSLAERREMLAGRQAELAGARAVQPTAVHVQTVDVLTRLLEMGKAFQGGSEIPAPLRVLMRTVEHMRPTLTAELASVPPEQIVSFMRTIEDEIHKITAASPAPLDGEEQSA